MHMAIGFFWKDGIHQIGLKTRIRLEPSLPGAENEDVWGQDRCCALELHTSICDEGWNDDSTFSLCPPDNSNNNLFMWGYYRRDRFIARKWQAPIFFFCDIMGVDPQSIKKKITVYIKIKKQTSLPLRTISNQLISKGYQWKGL
ncbi:hypothetical protein ACJX0J_030215, partial [Zea mays]